MTVYDSIRSVLLERGYLTHEPFCVPSLLCTCRVSTATAVLKAAADVPRPRMFSAAFAERMRLASDARCTCAAKGRWGGPHHSPGCPEWSNFSDTGDYS